MVLGLEEWAKAEAAKVSCRGSDGRSPCTRHHCGHRDQPGHSADPGSPPGGDGNTRGHRIRCRCGCSVRLRTCIRRALCNRIGGRRPRVRCLAPGAGFSGRHRDGQRCSLHRRRSPIISGHCRGERIWCRRHGLHRSGPDPRYVRRCGAGRRHCVPVVLRAGVRCPPHLYRAAGDSHVADAV